MASRRSWTVIFYFRSITEAKHFGEEILLRRPDIRRDQ
jgi:hypothetical protein